MLVGKRLGVTKNTTILVGGGTWLCVAASSMIFIHLFAGYVG